MAWEAGKPLTIETIDVQPPKAGEVRVKVSLYKTVAWTIRGGTRIYLRETKPWEGAVCHSLLRGEIKVWEKNGRAWC